MLKITFLGYLRRTIKNQAKPPPYDIVMVRHGQSEWNQKNLFCGWYDANLTEKGKAEAKNAGQELKKAGYKFSKAFTSVLTRANVTLDMILMELGMEKLPTVKSWRLNERHYGGLTGLDKAETAAKYGEKQVNIWRRSFDIPPPTMEKDHKFYNEIVNDSRYKEAPPANSFPQCESLKMTIERTMPFWENTIVPEIKAGKQILIVAHGNSLRGIVKQLDQLSADEIMKVNLPTGIPFVYTLDEDMKPVEGKSMRFLADPETLRKALATVVAQGKAKK